MEMSIAIFMDIPSSHYRPTAKLIKDRDRVIVILPA